jgi:hypothetical protein
MKSSIARILLENVTFSANPDPQSNSGSVVFAPEHERGTSLVRLTASGTGDYAFTVRYAAELTLTLDDSVPDDETMAVLRRALSALLSCCRDEITRLTLRGRFTPWTFDPFDIDALVSAAGSRTEVERAL